jgi:hypothetical protein
MSEKVPDSTMAIFLSRVWTSRVDASVGLGGTESIGDVLDGFTFGHKGHGCDSNLNSRVWYEDTVERRSDAVST